MSTTTKIHFLASGLTYRDSPSTFAPAAVSRRGGTIEITDEIRRLNSDSAGKCVFDLTHDEQAARWGEPKFAAGEAPDALNIWDGDPFLADKLREEAGAVAAQIADPAERAAELARIRASLGIKSTQSTTHYAK